jgi:short-subunit dehydrogenase
MGTALITGASSGLGLEFAKLFAAEKHDVVLVARRRERLVELAAELGKTHGIKALPIAADLQDAAAPKAVFDEVTKAGVEVEFLVNNAGFGTTGPFTSLELARELAEVQVNVTSLVALTHLFLGGMVKRGRGRVLNIASTAGFQAGPYMATYYASKAFVVSFTEALSYELKGTGVTATVSCPGATATEFSQVAGNDKTRLFKMQTPMSAAQVAAEGYRAMQAGKVIALHGLMNRLGVWSAKVTPRPLLRSIAAAANQAAGPDKQLAG